MREITTHKVHEDDRQPQVMASEDKTIGGAPDFYELVCGAPALTIRVPFVTLDRGGVTNEALLAIVIDRLEGFQSGQFACDENEAALQAIKNALFYLQQRTRDRMERGVEGHAKA